MRGNITSQHILRFTPVTTGSFVVAGGAVGWVDTDVSATTGTDTYKLWCVRYNWAAGQDNGARAHGSAVDNKALAIGMILTYVDSSGHCDLYRGAANGTYNFIGYLS